MIINVKHFIQYFDVMEHFKYTCNVPFRVISSGSRGKGEPIISFNAISGSL